MPLFARKPVSEVALECPHDGATMAKKVLPEATVDECPSCRGVWFDEGELRRVAHDKELERLATRTLVVKVSSPFRCPRCGHECVEGHVAEVEVDSCTSCRGVWLDRGELAEAQRRLKAERLIAVSGGGFRDFLTRL